MLVVIAIIAILASILLPALSKAKEKAACSECQSRLKQWITAALMYADENDQRMPTHGDACGVSKGWGDPNNRCEWEKAAPFVGIYPGNTISRNELWYCPAVVEQQFQTYSAGWTYFKKQRKYGWNITGMSFNEGFRLQRMTAPHITVIQGDTLYTGPYIRWQDPSGTDCAGDQGIVTWGCLSLRHMNGSNVTFGDGHAAWYNYNSMRGDAGAGKVKWSSPH
ncbi:MAG: hypothetical protein A3K19_16600 [Lentisphaerae bacterium RIFOXYB12_FULL_65_16]|nr:MAG: hypothetical protein A3K19_16600 [Lentisphaerae bacterium RIFOXYB12_FULL_65_16]